VFCARDVSSSQIIGFMTAVSDLQIEMKIAPPESLFMIGSNSIEKSGDIAILDVNSITLPQNKRIKMLMDIGLSMLSMILWPVCFWIVKNPIGWFKNCCSVLLGRRTWVGPDVRLIESDKLAKMYIKPAVIHPSMGMGLEKLSHEALVKINTLYIKDYNPWRDLRLMWKCRALWGQVNS
jgi:lipopolysaccharide/colanic/teichoic acid biosynthesis glycosyltransferase